MDSFVQFLANPACLSIIVITVFSLSKLSVPLSLIIGAVTAGIVGGMSLEHTLGAFLGGISGGVNVALSYALLGMFATGLTTTGLPEFLASKIVHSSGSRSMRAELCRAMLFIWICGIASQTIIPIHIAFIPIIIPAFLPLFNEVNLDRRSIACLITFGLVATYSFLPFGFGEIFLREIVLGNLKSQGVNLALSDFSIMKLTAIPTAGMVFGLTLALWVSYRKPRYYEKTQAAAAQERVVSKRVLIFGLLAIVAMLTMQIVFKSMIVGALSGFFTLLISGTVKWKDSDKIVTRGFGMMATIGMIMIIANGFSAVLSSTGAVNDLINMLLIITANNVHLTVIVMLVIGLIITLGIGSSFSTVPILAAIFVPICQRIGFSPEGTFLVLMVAGVVGDAGSIVSDSTLGTTIGLNADDQHNHFRDSVVPTFLHFNIPQLIFGYAAIILFA